ncbi:PDDEXK nuclease domain-containing protein [Rhodoferax antarcticus]|uniref:PDDEXK nuclease domain-containing protein n=1 Tax=Rhodoferax antarcticus TaxID=81479 RepID=UPI00222433A0|nr:PDDEXK nuclease domain-containing protein [Rhodoferax antarcticus]MCW2310930.1 putative nuclease of restriction endonuclease-like (RecB) superfamily [Rhodoferax antarcticus]
MSKPIEDILPPKPEALFDRVAVILDEARGNVVRAVNTQMVLAYWLIGREIVQELQGGEERAAYGKGLVADLSRQLTQRYGKGFSVSNLWYFRQFYLAFIGRVPIPHPLGGESSSAAIPHPVGGELTGCELLYAAGRNLKLRTKSGPPSAHALPRGFSPQLSWSHYRVLMQVTNLVSRDFYEREAIAGGWDKRTLERQLHSFYYERTLKSAQPARMLAQGRRLTASVVGAVDILKNPYVLEFLGLPNMETLYESNLERAVITHLQRFLLELGNGFAFVARQKHIRIEDQDRFIDLVFYHCQLKFYLLIDLKVGKLTHGDVGQMDGYVRMFDALFTAPDDNPTIGLILCTEKSETVARYSVLNDRKQIFASKYMLSLPTEEQLRLEIERERRLIESALEERSDE